MFVPWTWIADWAGGVGAGDRDVGIPSHTQKKTGRVGVIEKYRVAVLGTGKEGKTPSHKR